MLVNCIFNQSYIWCNCKYKLIEANTLNYNALQKTELYILDSIKKICKDFDIPFFLVGGTLLGAVRHQGMLLCQ